MAIQKGKITSLSFSTNEGETWEEVPIGTIHPETITGKIFRPSDLLKLRNFAAAVHARGEKLRGYRNTNLPRLAFATSGPAAVGFGVDAFAVFASWCERDPRILLTVGMPNEPES